MRVFLVLSIFVLSLSGCGFTPRGLPVLPQYEASIEALELKPYSPYDPLYQTLVQTLNNANITVLTPSENDEGLLPVLKYSKMNLEQYTLVYGPKGQIRRERLTATLHYELLLANREMESPKELTSRSLITIRDRQLNQNQDLADEYEKKLLEKEMRQELVSQLVRQLSFIGIENND